MYPPNLRVYADRGQLCQSVAQRIAECVREKPDAVLGLPTGATPIAVYQELAEMCRQKTLDFSRVITFNLDEYFPMPPQSPPSYHAFMRRHLFDHVNCRRWFVPDGTARSAAQVGDDCATYEQRIQEVGGLDLVLLGIGRTGHIGFNEPGSLADTRTRLVVLAPETRADALPDFGNPNLVPSQAITMGVGTILEARAIILMASGERKADAVRQAVEGDITALVPASFLRRHPNVGIYLDMAAAQFLSAA